LKDGGIGTLLDVGLAGWTIAHVYQTHLPHVRVTGVEIDPDVVELGRKYFTLDEPNLEISVCDGRFFLATTHRRFDAIAVDVFRQPHVPFPFTTREFFGLVKERLSPGGAMLMNAAAMGRDDLLLTGLLNTAASVFREVGVYQPAGHRTS
jgi:spermidine synthase